MAFLAAIPALTAISAAAGVVGTVVSAVGAIAEGNQQSAMAKYNADVAEAQGAAAQQAAKAQSDQLADRTKRLLAQQRAITAANGFTLEGSPFEVMDDTAAQAAYDGLLIRHAGDIEAQQYYSQAAFDRLNAKTARTNGYYGAGAKLLSGLSSVAGSFEMPDAPAATPATLPQAQRAGY